MKPPAVSALYIVEQSVLCSIDFRFIYNVSGTRIDWKKEESALKQMMQIILTLFPAFP